MNRRIVGGAVVALVLVAGLPGPVTGTAGAQPAGSGASQAELSASALARATGKRVEVSAKQTESSETFAEPDGTFTAVLHAGQIRTRTATGWTSIDTTLRSLADGSVAPAATVVSMAFSGGGNTPLVRLWSGDKEVELSWPEPLPKPVLAGDTATYPEVLPGVDLRLTAGSSGFQEVAVVKTRAAGANPRLAKISFGIRTKGLQARIGQDGASEMVDGAGKVIFTSPAPQLRDAADKGAIGKFESTKDTLIVVPDQSMLTDPETVFPVEIDPDWWAPAAGWSKVFSGYPNNSYWNGGSDVEEPGTRFAGQNLAKVGYCGWAGCKGIGMTRSYFQFDITGLHGAQVVGQAGVTTGAEFNAHEIWAPTCNGSGHNYAMDLHPASFTGSYGATWNSQPWVGWETIYGGPRWVTHGYNANCGAAWVGWGVGEWVRYANDNRAQFATFMLRGDNEGDAYTWKKFDGYQLLVHYNWPPNAPSNLGTSTGSNTLPCTGVRYVNNAAGAITLRATASDRDDSQSMWMQFEWWTRDHQTRLGYTIPGPQGDPSEFTATLAKGTFAHGAEISWKAHAGDGWAAGPESGWCDLTIDNLAPTTPPTLTPVNPPPVPRAGDQLTFNVAANGIADVASYRYGLSRGGSCTLTGSVNAANLGGNATFSVTPMAASLRWDLWVASVDRAGNTGPCLDYTFQVSNGSPPVAQWPMDGDGTNLVPDRLHRHDGTITGTTGWANGRLGDAVNFDGHTGTVTTTGGPAVDTTRSFSVTAWVRLDGGINFRTAVSQDAGVNSAFYLQAMPDNRWAMAAGCNRAVSAQPAQLGVWTHLAGVFDAPTGTMTLYVNGIQVGAAAACPPASVGPVRIAAAKYNNAIVDYFPGGIDDIQIYDRMLSDLPFALAGERIPRSEIDRLAAQAVEEAAFPMDEGSGVAAGDQSGNYRNATIAGGTWVPGRVGQAIHLDGSGKASTTGAIVRTDRSFTAMAFARIDNPLSTAWEAVFSQDGVNSSGFLVEYRPDNHKWSASIPSADSASPGWQTIDSTSVAQAEWTHLAVVYDTGASELRLYVNGAWENSRTVTIAPNIAGAFILGRGQQNGPCCGFSGSIDEARVYTGVLSDQEIRDASAQEAPRPPSLQSGQFARYASHDGHHYVGPGPVPPGYHLEGPLGMVARTGDPNTRMIYSCRYSGGFFLDPAANCAGYEVLGQAGLMYTQPPAGIPTATTYRCLIIATGDHFVSFQSDCESTPDKVRTEFVLGHTRLYAPLIRYLDLDGGHWTSAHGGHLPPGVVVEQGLGYISMGGIPGNPPILRMCRNGSDEFLSTDPNCEGATNVDASGWIWPDPPPAVAESRQLFACRTPAGERFESLDQFCEGGETLSVLGYVITRF